MDTPNLNSLLTPEPSIQSINANQHDYAVPGPSSVQPKVSRSSSDRRRKRPPSTPKEERKRSIRPRLSATVDGYKDSQLDSQVSAHRTPYGRLLHSEYFTLRSTDPSDRLYSLLNH